MFEFFFFLMGIFGMLLLGILGLFHIFEIFELFFEVFGTLVLVFVSLDVLFFCFEGCCFFGSFRKF